MFIIILEFGFSLCQLECDQSRSKERKTNMSLTSVVKKKKMLYKEMEKLAFTELPLSDSTMLHIV